MTRLHTLVEAKRKDLELELKQYDRREKKITELLDAVEQKRKEREKAGASKGSRTRSSGEESSSDPE
jgi:non-homologous end joining protein Ku